jgi:hypothetical protein
MNPVTTGTARRDAFQNDEKYSRAARAVFGKITFARVKCSSVVTNSRASTNCVRRNRFRYAEMMSAERRSPKLAATSRAAGGQ